MLIVLCVAFMLATALLGCAVASKDQQATFQGYERVQTAPAVGSLGQTLQDGSEWTPAKYKSTGNATVAVGGMEVTAKCPIQGLEQGVKVLVRQNDDGTWVVVGKQ